MFYDNEGIKIISETRSGNAWNLEWHATEQVMRVVICAENK